MADFLVTINGKYLFNGLSQYLVARDLYDGIDWAAENLNLPVEFNFRYDLFDSLFVDRTGRVQVFGEHMALYKIETNEHVGYLKIADFYDKAKFSKVDGQRVIGLGREIDIRYYGLPLKYYYTGFFSSILSIMGKPDPIVKTIEEVVRPKHGDKIYLVKRKIEDGNIKSLVWSYTYKTSHSEFKNFGNGLDYKVIDGQDKSQYTMENITLFQNFPDFHEDPKTTPLATVGVYSLASFYDSILANGTLVPGQSEVISLVSSEINFIEGITILFHSLFSIPKFTSDLATYSLANLFENFFKIFDTPLVSIEIGNDAIESDEYYHIYTIDYFANLYLRLHEFYLLVKGNMYDGKYHLLTFIFGLFDVNVLKLLDYNDKIKLLDSILGDNKYISGRWNPFESKYKLTLEEVIVRIVQSIKVSIGTNLNYEDINLFMDKLCKVQDFGNYKNITLLEYLDWKIDANIIIAGAGAQGQLMDAIYSLWVDSKYNPKSSIPGNITRFPYTYTEHNAENPPPGTNAPFDYDAAPPAIAYQSTKKWLWYRDNLTLSFVAMENEEEMPRISVKRNGTPYGAYHVFQPISLTSVNLLETYVAIPIDKSVLQQYEDPCHIEVTGRGSNLPVFYLKYIDGIGDKKDVEEILFVVVDVVSILASGWGIARRLLAEGSFVAIRKISRTVVTDGIAAAIAELSPNMRKILLGIGLSSLDLLVSSCSIAYRIVEGNCTEYNDCNNTPPQESDTENYAKYIRCQAIQKWLFALEILTLSADLISQSFFKKASRELRERLPTDRNPYSTHINNQHIISNNDYNTMLSMLDEITLTVSSREANFISSFPQSVQNSLDALPISIRQDFVTEFIDQSEDALALLRGAEAEVLYTRWKRLYNVNSIDRSDVRILSNPALVNKFEIFNARTSIQQFISKLDPKKRMKFVEKYADPPYNFTVSDLDQVANSPSRRALMVSHMDSDLLRHADKFNDIELRRILTSELSEFKVALLEIKTSRSLKRIVEKFNRDIKILDITKTRMLEIHNGSVFNNFNTIINSNRKLSNYQDVNKLFVEIRPYTNNVPGSIITERYIAGRKKYIDSLFGNGRLEGIVEPADYDLFDIFSMKAFDIKHNRPRIDDTELKFVYSFLDTHWSTANRFDITIESTYFACQSCQGYLLYLKKMAKDQGKILNISFKANSAIKGAEDLNKFLK